MKMYVNRVHTLFKLLVPYFPCRTNLYDPNSLQSQSQHITLLKVRNQFTLQYILLNIQHSNKYTENIM